MDKTPQERIKADAEAAAKIVEQRIKSRNIEYGRMVSQVHGYTSGYITGATAENYFATPLYDALLELFALKELKDKHGKTPEYLKRQPVAWQKVKEALNKWKGKEPHWPEPQPDLGTCVECGTRKAVSDYNGHRYYVCDPCNNRLNREFDKEYN